MSKIYKIISRSLSIDMNVCTILFQGLTVTTEESSKVIVARIIINSVIERQGLLRPGDLILEANGVRVKTPEQLQNMIEDSPEFITLKIQPTLSVSQSQPSNIEERHLTPMPTKVPSSHLMIQCIIEYFIVLRALPLQL